MSIVERILGMRRDFMLRPERLDPNVLTLTQQDAEALELQLCCPTSVVGLHKFGMVIRLGSETCVGREDA